jgi:hypothetical protein
MPKTVVILTVQDLRHALQKAEENVRTQVVLELQEPIEVKGEIVYRVPVLSEDRV